MGAVSTLERPSPSLATGVPAQPKRNILRGALNDWYVVACTVSIAIWLTAWLLTFPNLYGWLTDDAQSFYRISIYERGGDGWFDIQWFHAYMWLFMFLPYVFHWSIPSHMIPRLWYATGEFRALILLTIVCHAGILGIVAKFMRVFCANRLVCFGAFLIFLLSPTFNLYADLLDSRYMGLIFGLPSIMILLGTYEGIDYVKPTVRSSLLKFAFPGFLIGVGQSMHYTELYLCGPFALSFWVASIKKDFLQKNVWIKLAAFVGGILAWFAPIQWLSLQYHPFADSMIGTLISQVDQHLSPYSRLDNFLTWLAIIRDQMGIPLTLLVIAGVYILTRDRLRPAYVTAFRAKMMVWTAGSATVYFLATPAYPFFRQLSGLQIFYAVFAAIAIERIVNEYLPDRWLALADSRPLKIAVTAVSFVATIYLPTFMRMPEVFVDQQGLGRAINYTYTKTNADHVYFLPTYDWDPNARAVLTRKAFDALNSSDYLVSDYPIFFHVKYPDLFAALYDAKPVASYPTEWCTQETWAELRSYFAFRKWFTEPENCDSQVFRMSDVIHEMRDGTPLKIARVEADSELNAQQTPQRIFAERNPKGALDDNYFGRTLFDDLWASQRGPWPHYVDVTFAKPVVMGAVTIVPPDFQGPPDFTNGGRVSGLEIEAAPTDTAPLGPLWRSGDTRDSVIIRANFAATQVQRLRFNLLGTSDPVGNVAALEYIRFPGFVTDTRGTKFSVATSN